MRIYLAGGRGAWRGDVARWRGEQPLATKVYSIELVDPFVDSPQGVIAEFTLADLAAIRECNVVLAYHSYHVFDGLALECGFAYALGKPIVYVCKQPRASSMICGVSAAVFTELEPALEFIARYYLEAP